MTPSAPVSPMLPPARPPFRRPRAAALLLALCAAMGCGEGGGSGSETTLTGIAGKVVDAAGNPVPGAAVYVRPEGALPPGIMGAGGQAVERPSAVSAADGGFRIERLPAGEYIAEFRAAAGAAVLEMRAADTLVRLPDAVLRPAGAIRGKVTRLPDGQTSLFGAYVYLPGLLPLTFISFDGRDTVDFLLEDVPAGTHALRVTPGYPLDMEHYKLLELPAVQIAPGDTADVGALSLPSRSGPRDSAYARDSSAVAALLRANGIKEEEVSRFTGELGDRITMLFDVGGRITRLTPDLQRLDQVEFLNLSAYLIPDTESLVLEGAEEIARLRGLRQLQILKYRLDGGPEWLGSLTKLEELVLGSTGLRKFPEAVAGLPFLYRLSIYGDSIGTLPDSIAGMRRLRILEVSNGGLSALPAELAEVPFLSSLSLSRNRFASVPPVLLGMGGLRRLDLSGNELGSLPEGLMRMPALRGFLARDNRLCGLAREWKEWLDLQDSLWYDAADTSLNPDQVRAERNRGWEATQRCPAP